MIDEQDMLDVAVLLKFRVFIEVFLFEVLAALFVADWEVKLALEDRTVRNMTKMTYVSLNQALLLELLFEILGRSDPQTSCGHSA